MKTRTHSPTGGGRNEQEAPDEVRAVVESEWPELMHKLPPKRAARLTNARKQNHHLRPEDDGTYLVEAHDNGHRWGAVGRRRRGGQTRSELADNQWAAAADCSVCKRFSRSARSSASSRERPICVTSFTAAGEPVTVSYTVQPSGSGRMSYRALMRHRDNMDEIIPCLANAVAGSVLI
jgi:hypothetical protein